MTTRSARDRAVYSAKWAMAQSLHVSGLLALRRQSVLRNRAVVLAYHRLLPEGTSSWSHPGVVVAPETFERHMRVLQREFRLLTIAEFEKHMATGEPFEPASCLVTFDDGWIDTYEVAWPILRQLRIPAVLFLPTRYIGSPETFWQERLGMLLFETAQLLGESPASRTRISAVLEETGLAHFLQLLDRRDRSAIIDTVRDLKLNRSVEPAQAIERLVQVLGSRAAVEHDDRFITWDHVREMVGQGLAVGVHGHTHRILSTLPDEDVAAELETARTIIEREVSQRVTTVSYPNGGWNDRVADRVRSMGFQVAFSMQRGHVGVSDSAYSICRMNVHEDLTGSDALFRGRILGVL
jgi:peptidoglycan/xylan/chitin deacetylase (PgdA/CDA1 family)